MRKDSSDDVAAMARQRLEYLGRQLAAAGLHPSASQEPPEPVLVLDPGRHARGRPARSRLGAWLDDRLPGPLQGRLALGATQVVMLVVLLAGAVVLAAWTTIRSAPDEVPLPVAHTSPGPPATAPGTAPVTGTAAGSTVATPAPLSEVVVDVAGKVRRPGVTRLPVGSRVIDALRRAGGARPGVDLSSLNLARVLVDGEQILVGTAARPAGAGLAPGVGAGSAGALVSLNSAGLDLLDSLPGVGPVTAQKIIDWRTAHGAFTSVEELLEVDGIGTKTLAELTPRVTL